MPDLISKLILAKNTLKIELLQFVNLITHKMPDIYISIQIFQQAL